MYLNTHTYYSLRYGTLSVDELLEVAQQGGVQSLVLTDINNTSGCIDFIRKAPQYGIKPIVGVDFRNDNEQCFVAIAKNNEGFEEINTFLTDILQNKKKVPEIAPVFTNVFVVYPYKPEIDYQLEEYEFIGIAPHNLNLLRVAKKKLDKTVIFKPLTFRNKRDLNIHRILLTVGKNTLLSQVQLPENTFTKYNFITQDELLKCYEDFPDTINNTLFILASSSIYFDFSTMSKPQNQKTYTESEEEDIELLKSLCERGLNYRYPSINDEIAFRIQKELSAIVKMGFVSYFLINWDIVSYARSRGYFYVGRGSGANSVVAYLLRITDVDPIELDLYFERFINEFRSSPPDFDIDFSWKDREDVTQYIFDRFKHVALVANYNRYQFRGAIRALGKVFGLPKEEIDSLSHRNLPQNNLQSLVLRYSGYIKDFPNNLSVHASGIIISEKPINYFSATFLPPKGYPTIQFDMHIAEDIGLHKFDILSQRGLSKIKEAMSIIEQQNNGEQPVDIHDIQRFKQDERVKSLLKNSDTVGCFYVESPAMRMLFTKLEVDTYLGLVAASSIIRPGVAQSGMMQEYIKRSKNPERRKDAHPTLLELMPETYGVMVYQEDVIKVAHHFADLTLGEADKMRRGMSGKYRSRDEFEEVKQKFFSNCVKKGYSLELTSEIWRQTESFAGYAFAKGHSASYAVESYQCLFLKAYYPLEFLVATVNNSGGFYRTDIYLHEAKKNGGIVHPPCVNHSNYESTLFAKDIYLGFHLVHSFDHKTAISIVTEREKNGFFTSFDNFIDRVKIGIEQCSLLIRVNAFSFTGINKRSLLWEAHFKLGRKAESSINKLFKPPFKKLDIPQLTCSPEEDAFDQIELLGFSITDAFSLLQQSSSNHNYTLAKQMRDVVGQFICIRGTLVHIKHTSTSKGAKMYFGTFLDENGDWLDTVHFPPSTPRYPFSGPGVYRMTGLVIEEFNFISLDVRTVEKLPLIEDPRYTENKQVPTKQIETSNNRKDYWSGRINQL